MDTPGYDPVSATGQVAGGANMIVLHDGPRLCVWMRARAIVKAVDEHRAVDPAGGGHRLELRRDRRWHRDGRRNRHAAVSIDARDRIGGVIEKRKHGYGQSEFVPWYVGAVM